MIFPTIFLRPDILAFVSAALIIAALAFTGKKQWLPHFGIALGISMLWNLIAINEYGYNQEFFSIGPINAFPLFAWPVGLFLIHSVYIAIHSKYSVRGLMKQLLLFIAIYWPSLLIVETIGYYTFHIRNDAAAHYASLPLCDCLHAPLWMQVAYFLIGPIYFLSIHFALQRAPQLTKAHRG